jgi:addiction module RelE/StbE family toxin
VKVRYTRKALAQLDQIYSYIEAHNPTAAKRVKARIKRSIARLERHPHSCRATEHPGIRVLPIVRYPYLVFYSVDEGPTKYTFSEFAIAPAIQASTSTDGEYRFRRRR